MLDAPADEALVDGTEVLDADEDYNEPEGGNNSSEDDDTQK
jgi:hypothetical protein